MNKRNRAFKRAIASLTALSLATVAAPAGAQSNASLEPLETYTLYGAPGNFLGATMSQTGCNMLGDETPEVFVTDWNWVRNGKKIGAGYGVTWENFKAAAEKPQPIDDEDVGVVRIENDSRSNSSIGFSAACLGDTNGNGFDDIVMNDFQASTATVVFGDEDLDTTSTEFFGDKGYFMKGAQGSRFSNFVNAVGDLDGDGRNDIAVTTYAAKANPRIEVFSGSDDIATYDAAADSSRLLMTVKPGSNAIQQFVNVGDINGDGKDDFAVTSYAGKSEASKDSANGLVWVLFGQDKPQDVDLSQPLGERGFVVTGPLEGKDRLGMSVAAAGDLNGDGYDDVVIGADSLRLSGAAVVLWGGKSSADVTTDFGNNSNRGAFDENGENRGVVLMAPVDATGLGYSVAVAKPQVAASNQASTLVLGAFSAAGKNGEDQAGQVHLVSSTAVMEKPSGVIDLGSLPASQHSVIYGEAGERIGRAVSAPGDMNGDGNPDIAFGGDAPSSGRNKGLHSTVTLATMPPQRTNPDLPVIPVIGDNGNWWVNGKDTGVHAQGQQGEKGKSAFDLWAELPGNENKTLDDFWEFLRGPAGDQGDSPIIGDNGNWWVGGKDTGVKATGEKGDVGKDGKDSQDGKDGKDGQDGQSGDTASSGSSGSSDESKGATVAAVVGGILGMFLGGASVIGALFALFPQQSNAAFAQIYKRLFGRK